MRIHRLEVEAFGPFAERVVLDLDALTAGGLFLVHGPTGAGKTSLLDAVAFALYADVPGARAKQGLRSDHAAPDAVPEVVLEVTVGARRLRLTRSPAWLRPKKRGTGTTPVQATVRLEERDGRAWRTLSTRNDEVADVVKDVLGMGLAQFAKVVLLPQGEFAAFLRATPEDRREVLERLFDIEVFTGVEAWLAEQRRVTGAELEAAAASLRSGLVRLEDALAGTDLAPGRGLAAGVDDGLDDTAARPPLTELPVAEVPGRIAGFASALGSRVTDALAAADAAAGADRAAQGALDAARELAGHRRRGLRARAVLDGLAASAADHADRRHRLALAERAAGVAGHLAAHDRALVESAARAEALTDTRALASRAGLDPEAEPRGLAAALHAHDDVVARIADAASEAARTRVRLEAAEALRHDLDARRLDVAAGLEAAGAAVADAETALGSLAEDAGAVPALEARLRTAHERLALLDAVDADAARRHDLAPRLLTAREAVADAREALLDLRQRRLDGMAAELAAGLDDGSPCPVCGAHEHPEPAVAVDAVGPDEVARAETVVEAARAALSTLDARDTGLRSAVDTRLESLAGAGRADLEAEVALAEADLAAARESRAALDAARAALAAVRHRAEALGLEQATLEARLEAAQTSAAALEADATALADRLAADVEAHRGCPCGTTAPAAHRAAGATADALVRALDDATEAAERTAAAADDLSAAVEEAGFADADAARAALLAPADVAALRRAVDEHVHASAAATGVLDEPEVRAALDADEPDVPALEDAAATARRGLVAASTAHDAAERALRGVERLRAEVEAAATAVLEVERRHLAVRELADTTSGTGADNTLRMRLSSFVLAARLEKVATLANERLAVMGGGRYLLEHSDDRAARGARSGLGLRVLDQWTGRVRDTASLSGGESFMASLALALGLADAVREEAGGLDLGTLFVDEGFGTLDDESLEQVLTVLDGLREGGRAVGVVSHVADLRTRIPHQAVVTKGPTGSSVAVRTGAEAPAA